MFQSSQQIGPYTLVRILGRGNYGEVWLAEKHGSLLTTQVALKLPVDPDTDIAAIQKEAQTWLRASGHPNVLPVLDAEVIDGQVVIASEYASGGSLKELLRQHGGKAPSIEEAVTLTSGILAGLEHLHSLHPQPIIHRDLKSDNVLLQGGIPRITDFGISRVMKTSAFTQHATGTPSYMPPEAFEGKYSVQSDLWAVGILLYQMFSGRLPFPQEDLPSLYGAIKQHDYPPLPPEVPNALKAVVAKALAKDTAQRFATAREMREALYARPAVSVGNKANRGTRPTREPLHLPAVNLPVLLAGLLALLVLAIMTSVAVKHRGHGKTVDTIPPPASAAPLFSRVQNLAGQQGAVLSVAWSPDSKFIVTGTADGRPTLWNVADGKKIQTLTGYKEPIMTVSWSPDGKFIVTGTSDGIPKIWNVSTGRVVRKLKGPSGWVVAAAWSPDGKSIATASDYTTVTLWDAATGQPRRTLKEGMDGVNCLAWSPDSLSLVTGSESATAKVWNAETGQSVQTLTGHKASIGSVAWSPDGRFLATGSSDKTAKVWNVETGQAVQTLTGHLGHVVSVSWAPDSKNVVTGSSDKTAKVWNVETGQEKQTLSEHTDLLWAVAWSPDGTSLVTTSNDTLAKVWKASP